MRNYILILLFLITCINSYAQKVNTFLAIDTLALQIPDSSTLSTQAIANYINQHFTTGADKSRAAFIWIAKNIQYDVENMFAINFYKDNEEVIDEVLRERKGICMHYAELYNAIANKCNIPTYVVDGYTKQAGFVDYVPHSWCASFIDTGWYLFDPTWGAGYVNSKSKFIKAVDNKYFMAKPDSMISNHMPFDPIFQFLNYPITSQEFYEGNTQVNTAKSYFNYKDSLILYNKQNDIEKLMASSSRIEKNGKKNELVFTTLENQKREVEYLQIQLYNKAVSTSNRGIDWLNEFVNCRNHRLLLKKEDAEIVQMLDSASYLLNNAKEQLAFIPKPEADLAADITRLNKEIDSTITGNLDDQKRFLEKYLKTGKLFRKMML